MSKTFTILVIENDAAALQELSNQLKAWDYNVLAFRHPTEVDQLLSRFEIHLVLANLELPDTDGLTFLQQVKKTLPGIPQILTANQPDKYSAIRAINTVGVFALLEKPLRDDDLRLAIRSALEGQSQLAQAYTKIAVLEDRNAALTQQNKELALQNIEMIQFIQKQAERVPNIVGSQSRVIQHLRAQLDAISKIEGPVLISGERGVGKEQAARAIYQNSLRQRQSFFVLDCAYVPEAALNAELFDGKSGGKPLLESAHRGTILLKNVDALTPVCQKRLLHFIKTRQLPKTGTPFDIEYNVRFLTTTAKNLREAVQAGQFDEALFFELTLIPLNIPPLRERSEDIPELVAHFVSAFNQKYDKKILQVEAPLLAQWQRQLWPGNVRELEHLVYQMCLTTTADRLRLADLPADASPRQARVKEIAKNEDLAAFKPLAEYEREYLQHVVDACGGNRSKAARILGIKRTTLLFRLDKLGVV